MTTTVTREGMRTPWGRAQSVTKVADGIALVSTASHGGFKLNRAKNAMVPAPLRRTGGWYEEDCESAIVIFTFPEHFPGRADSAVRILKQCFPDGYEAATGQKVAVEESYVLAERAFRAETVDKLVVIAAFCAGHPAWPASLPTIESGNVGVVATLGGVRGQGADERWFILPEDIYRASAHTRGFVIEPMHHREVKPHQEPATAEEAARRWHEAPAHLRGGGLFAALISKLSYDEQRKAYKMVYGSVQ